jgi:selenide,water dikinase
VTGVIDPNKVAKNSGARPGDRLILTKALGTGIISTGIKFGKATDEIAANSVKTMLTAGKQAAELMQEFAVRGATDVTGFALLGHAWELARASQATIEVDSSALPILPGALEMAAQGLLTSGNKTNREYVGTDIAIADSVSEDLRRVMFDPQTAGGLLIAISADKAEALLTALRQTYPDARVIGEVSEKGEHSIVVK